MTDSTDAAETANNPYASTKAAYYALGILTLVYSINFIDRQLLSILQESIKADLMLSDAQLAVPIVNVTIAVQRPTCLRRFESTLFSP